MRAKQTDWRREDVELVRLVSLGLRNKEIAARLRLSETAIKKRLCTLMRRVQVDSRAALVRAAFVSGFMPTASDIDS